MTDSNAQLIFDCADGKSFAWERFVDQFLPVVARVVEFALDESGHDLADQDSDSEKKEQIITAVFQEFASDDYRLFKEYDGPVFSNHVHFAAHSTQR